MIGNIGLQLFFAISGFLITGLLLKEQTEKGNINIKKFYLRRLIRICPVYFVYLGIILLIKATHISEPNYKDISIAALFISDFGNVGNTWLVAHTWSLSVEQQFYLCWPIVFVVLPRKYFYLFAIIIIYDLLYFKLRFYPVLFVFHSLFISALPIIFGAFLSIALYKDWLKKVHHILMHPAFALSFFLAILIYLPRTYQPASFLKIPYDYTISCFFIVLFMNYAIHCDVKNIIYRLLNNRVIVYIGILSYSIYIWQQIFLAPTYNFTVYPSWTIFPLNIVLAVATAIISYNLIEKPFLRLKAQLK